MGGPSPPPPARSSFTWRRYHVRSSPLGGGVAEAVLMARAFTDCLGVAARAAPCLVFDRRRCEEEWLRLFRWPERLQIGSALRHGWPLAPPPRAHQSPGAAIIFDRSCCDKQWQWRHRLPELWCWGGWCFLPATAMDLLFPPSLPP